MNVTKALAFALGRLLAKTAHSAIGGNVQSSRTALTRPRCSSGANIHSEATVGPMPASTASRTPSAAVILRRPFMLTEVSVAPRLKLHTVPPPRRS
jgi:hypothetical protein